jgi:imidazolonepropionase-like amidohydrolase
LQTATINPAKYLDIEKTNGTVAVNKNANLILLAKKPLDDIKNTQSIEMVFLKGKPFTSIQLQQMMDNVKKMVAGIEKSLLNVGIHAEE